MNNIELPAATGVARSQATVVEQSRAVAEVQGMIIVAQRVPRNVALAINQMEETCRQMLTAESYQFRFKRGGKMVSGASIHLLRELARCWGNISYSVDELDVDETRTEVSAWAWDLQTNTRVSRKFFVPHSRHRTAENGGPTPLFDPRDIYENNANAGARRVRECIKNLLPPYFVATAMELCAETLKKGNGVPLQQRIAEVVSRFHGLGVTIGQLERRQGRGSNAWNENDIVELWVVGRSLQNGEIRIEDEFESDLPRAADFAPATPPAAAVSAPEVARDAVPEAAPESVPSKPAEPAEQTVDSAPTAAAPPPGMPKVTEPPEPGEGGPKANADQLGQLEQLLAAHGVTDPKHRTAVVSLLLNDRVIFTDLRAREVAYLWHRVNNLVAEDKFAGSAERARREAGLVESPSDSGEVAS